MPSTWSHTESESSAWELKTHTHTLTLTCTPHLHMKTWKVKWEIHLDSSWELHSFPWTLQPLPHSIPSCGNLYASTSHGKPLVIWALFQMFPALRLLLISNLNWLFPEGPHHTRSSWQLSASKNVSWLVKRLPNSIASALWKERHRLYCIVLKMIDTGSVWTQGLGNTR